MRQKWADITGMKFNRLTVLERVPIKGKPAKWKCLCDCGKEKLIITNAIISGKTKSCGCLRDESIVKRSTTHGMSGRKTRSKLNITFHAMKQRCYYTKDKSYTWYGAKGIKICEEWLNNFLNFSKWALENGYKEGLTIDRIDSNGDYCPENCQWVTKSENTSKRNEKLITFNGKTQNIKEWAKEMEIDSNTLYKRFDYGWSIEKALTKPKKLKKNEKIT